MTNVNKVRFTGRHFALGISQVVLGSVCLLLDVIDVCISGRLILIGTIFAFILVIVAGILGIIAARTQIRGLFIACMVLSILAAGHCASGIQIEVVTVYNLRREDLSFIHHGMKSLKFLIVLVLMIAEIVVAIMQAVLVCCVPRACICCKDSLRENFVTYTELSPL